MKNKNLGLVLLTAALAASTTAASAAVDFAPLTTGLVDQVEDAAGYAIPIIAAILGIGLIFKLIRRWAK